MLGLPSEDEVIGAHGGAGLVPDPPAVYAARRGLTAALAAALGDRLGRLYAGTPCPGLQPRRRGRRPAGAPGAGAGAC